MKKHFLIIYICTPSVQTQLSINCHFFAVLREIVIQPSPNVTCELPSVIGKSPALLSYRFPFSPAVEVGSEAEDVRCSQLLFRDDFLSEQYFGENRPFSIVTEKVHFGEGMHRRAFRTRLRRGGVPLLLAGPSCVLKVHTAISYGIKNNDELVKRNYSLAVEVSPFAFHQFTFIQCNKS